jgi:hypothetical protein
MANFNPYIEPRTQVPSLHNHLYASLPLGMLQMFHNDARHGSAQGIQQAHIHDHAHSLLQPMRPARAAVQQAWVSHQPMQAFTPTVHAPDPATGHLRQVRRR